MPVFRIMMSWHMLYVLVVRCRSKRTGSQTSELQMRPTFIQLGSQLLLVKAKTNSRVFDACHLAMGGGEKNHPLKSASQMSLADKRGLKWASK